MKDKTKYMIHGRISQVNSSRSYINYYFTFQDMYTTQSFFVYRDLYEPPLFKIRPGIKCYMHGMVVCVHGKDLLIHAWFFHLAKSKGKIKDVDVAVAASKLLVLEMHQGWAVHGVTRGVKPDATHMTQGLQHMGFNGTRLRRNPNVSRKRKDSIVAWNAAAAADSTPPINSRLY